MIPRPRPRLPLALAAAVLGGMGAVAAEVVFTRRLAVLFGIAAPAAATVVAVYMFGMAIGAAAGGRGADRLAARAGWLYVAAEIFALAWALAFDPLHAAATSVYAAVPPRWGLAACALLTAFLVGPAAVASGATFPSLSRLVGEERAVRRLYTANTAGAAVGGLVAGLWLPSLLGLHATLLLAGAASAAAALSMIPVACAGSARQPIPLEDASLPLPLAAAGATYALLGGLGMAAEIGWTRLLEQTGPNPATLAFPLVLAAYLVGLALGGAFLEPVLRRQGEARGLAIALVASGAMTLAGVGMLTLVPEERIVGHLVGPGPGNGAIFSLTGVQVSADRLAVYLLAALVPGIASGAGFPLAASAVSRSLRARGRATLGWAVGLTLAAGIASATGVALWLGFLPSWGPGVIRTLVALGVLALAVAALLMRSWRPGLLVPVGLLAFAAPPWAGMPIPPGERIDAFVETAAGPSAVATVVGTVPHGEPRTSVYTHGERVGGLRLEVAVPMALHREPARVLVIALGTGINIVSLLRDPAIRDLVCVDIDPALPRLVEHVPGVGPALFDGHRSRFVADDGRHWLTRTDERYDVIYSDVATYAQYAELGTREFFRLARSRLAPGGMVAAKVHADTLTGPGLEAFVATFLDVFPAAGLFADQRVPVLVGFTVPPTHEDLVARAVDARPVYGQDVVGALESRLLLGPASLPLLAGGRVSTDDHPLPFRTAIIGPASPERGRTSAISLLARAVRGIDHRPATELFGPDAPATIGFRGGPASVAPRRGWCRRDP